MSAKQRKLLWPVLIALAVIFSARLWMSARTKAVADANNASKTASGSVATALRAESAVITIRPTGFEPTAITATKGRIRLVVHNRSGLRSVHLLLAAPSTQLLEDVRVPSEQMDWSAFVNLPPGRYLVTEAEHPQWQCQITVSP